jgi:hypothetical protein
VCAEQRAGGDGEALVSATALEDLLEIEEGKVNNTRLYRCLGRLLPRGWSSI